MDLVKIEKSLSEIKQKQIEFHNEFKKKDTEFEQEIAELQRLKKLGLNNIDLNKIAIAESILGFDRGFKRKHVNTIKKAIDDVTNNFEILRKEYLGIKDYDRFSNQEIQCRYGYGPKHGYTVFSIGLKRNILQKEFTDEEKDACIYYLNHLIDNKNF